MKSPTEKLECRSCKRDTNHSYIYKHDLSDMKLMIFREYSIVECAGCNTVSFWSYYSDQSDTNVITKSEIYPNPSLKLSSLEYMDYHHVPEIILSIYRETFYSINDGHNTLGGIGVRAVIESVCNELNVPGKNLYSRINQLSELNHISPNESEMLHKLRVLGNKSAHEVAPQSLSDLKLSMDILNHLLLSVYVLPKKAQSFGE